MCKEPQAGSRNSAWRHCRCLERDLKRALKDELEFAGWGRKEKAFQPGNCLQRQRGVCAVGGRGVRRGGEDRFCPEASGNCQKWQRGVVRSVSRNFFFQFLFIYLAAPGLSCSTRGLRCLQPAGSLVTGCKLLVVVES